MGNGRILKINEDELSFFKQLYFKHYKVRLTDEEAVKIGNRLLGFIKAIAIRLPTAVQSSTK